MAKNNISDNSNDTLRWRFDVNTFRLLGRDLITDRITAVFELVKNCYDANSTIVTVDFYNTFTDSPDRKITISDNGIGMSFIDIKDKWMVVGTNSKRTTLYSDPPFNRKFVGEKGIGRFAVDKLGSKLLIKTKQINEKNWLNVTIDWDEYEKKSDDSTFDKQLSLFTEIDNEYYYEHGDANEQGTSLIISQVSEAWSELDIDRLYKELSKLISPFYPLEPPFNILINSNEFKGYNHLPVKADPIKFFSHKGEIKFDIINKKQEALYFDSKTGLIKIQLIDEKSFGPIKMKIFYFNESAKRKYNASYKNDDTRIDGIKIYRDGLITTPFAESESKPDKKRDILGIDKRRWRGTFDAVSTREIIGIVDISKENNPKIIDATNRQDFIDCPEYKELKEFIIQQIDVFGKVKEYERDFKRTVAEKELQKAGKEVKNFANTVTKIESEITKQKPELKNALQPLKQLINTLGDTITHSINEQKKYQKDVERKERILYSIVSMQEYASLISHAVRTSIAKVKHLGEFFKLNFPDKKFELFYKEYAIQIYDEMNTLLAVTDFMLSYANADRNYEEFNIKELIRDLLINSYSKIFEKEGIDLQIDIQDDFVLNTNKQAFQDIFQNLVSNSIKALKNTNIKKIKCTGFLDADNFTIYFSDNGYGVEKSDEEWIFGLYNTRTAEHGGAGIGLYIVEKQVKALNGTIELVDNEFKPTGATFKISIPFNKK
ncbi:MAG: sensor histidine kinase [Chitinophagales bacterium]